MDKRLVKAAREGDVNTLLNLMEEDPEILERASSAPFADSPLHVAALYGRSDFVQQVVSLMPSLAREINRRGMIPLHLASLKGHVETVKELLKVKLDDEEDDGVQNHQCLVKDDEGWTPLHWASLKGKIRVMEELISECPQSLEQVTAKGETVLHVAVKANQFKAVKLLANSIRHHNLQILLKIQDQEGRTSYQLAEAKKQFQVLEVLKEDDQKEDDEIREEHSIKLDGITTIHDFEDAKKTSLVRRDEGDEEEKDEVKEEISINVDKEKQQVALLAGFQNTGLLVATLIITLTYQGLANPPSTLFQPGTEIDWRCLSGFPPLSDSMNYKAFLKYVKSCPAYLALLFLVYNSMVFTLSICLLLSSVGGSHGFLLFMQFLAIFLVANYCVLLAAITVSAAYATLPISLLCYAFFVYLLYKERGIAKIKLPYWMGKLRGEK